MSGFVDKQGREFALSFSEFWERTRLPYEQKIEHARMVVESAIETHGDKVIVACSFGKASLMALHLAISIKPDIPVTFQNTLCQVKGVYQLRDHLKEMWGLNLYETRPGKGVNFWSVKKKYGYPSFKISRANNKQGRKEPRCCDLLKKIPAKKIYKELGIEGIILGIQGVESNNRKFVICLKGCMGYAQDEGFWKYYPAAFLLDEDIFKYLHENEIPYPQEYDYVDRLGCVPCTAFKGWEKNLSALNHRLYVKIAKEMNLPTLYKFV